MMRISAVAFTMAIMLTILAAVGEVQIRFIPGTSGVPAELRGLIRSVLH